MTPSPVLLRVRRHPAPFVLGILALCVPLALVSGVAAYAIWRSWPAVGAAVAAAVVLSYWYRHFFHARSSFFITPEKLGMDVRNWFFSRYDMSIHFSQIKDLAYSKNHLLHAMFGYGVLFVRSSAGADGNFTAPDIPDIERIYALVNRLYAMTPEERKKLRSLADLETGEHRGESEAEAVARVRRELLAIPGIREVEPITAEDRRYIFEHEEDRNHGVYECVRRQVTLAVTHDSVFRAADAPIVLRLGSKTVFPPVSFHELREKNVVSSSPGVDVHRYLVGKFKKVDEYDATLLIGFDL